MRSKNLNELVKEVLPGYQDLPDVMISGIALDSRRVRQGDIFFALKGGSSDGHLYIGDAIQKGAYAIVGSVSMPDLKVPYIQVEDSRLALALFSSAFFDHPSLKMVMIGVTGTDGKTTTCNLIYQILKTAGYKAGLISTVNAIIGDEILDTGFHVTTPEAPEIQEYLRRMVDAGLTHAIIETTSHGLDQKRVAACNFDLGVVTNITHEHLDYHGSYDAYRAAKGLLFRGLSDTPVKEQIKGKGAVLNHDDDSYPYLKAISQVPQLSYGIDLPSDFRATRIVQETTGLRFKVNAHFAGEKRNFQITSPLTSTYNVANCLAALATTVGFLGVPIDAARKGIASMHFIPGRMELIDLGQEFKAIVDFAHTPNALMNVLKTLRQELSRRDKTGRIIAVFGAAGLRDREKRKMMAQISAELSDFTILTAEDPRTEDLEAILDEMSKGMLERGAVEGKNYWRIPDRGDAIKFSVQLAQPGDIVIVCGKGHEQSMCFGTVEYPWDDRIAMRAAISEYLGIAGPKIPYLPTRKL